MVKQGKVGSLYESQQSYITEETQATQVHTSRCHTLLLFSIPIKQNQTTKIKIRTTSSTSSNHNQYTPEVCFKSSNNKNRSKKL